MAAVAPLAPDSNSVVPVEPGDRPPPVGWLSRESCLWLIVVVLMMTTGIIKSINLVIVLAYILLGLWVINLLASRRSVRGVSARRVGRPTVYAGVPAEWRWLIRDDRGVEGWSVEDRSGEQPTAVRAIRPFREVEHSACVTMVFSRRGRVRLEPLLARSTYPFGIVQRTRELTAGEELIVYPRPARVDLERLRQRLLRGTGDRDSEWRRSRRTVEYEADIHGVRDYRPGDPVRRIHWKVTARRGRPAVREYEDTTAPRLTLVVEAFLPDRPAVNDRERLEAVLSLASGILTAWRRDRRSAAALVLIGAEPTAIDETSARRATARQLELLAVEPGTSTSARIVLDGLSPAARRAPVVLVTSGHRADTVQAVRTALGRDPIIADVHQRGGWFEL